MKKLKWITISTYIDEDTGEVLTKHKAVTEYRIKKTILKKTITNMNKNGNTIGLRNYAGVTERTAICTKLGKQLKLNNW